MSIPDFQAIMLPFLKISGDQKEHYIRDVIEELAIFFELSEEEKKELLPSGQQRIFNNRVGWSRTYLKKACLIEYTKRGFFKITSRGVDVLRKNLPELNVKILKQFPEMVEFVKPRERGFSKVELEKSEQQTPEESIEYGYQSIRQDLAQELLIKIKDCSPSFFEKTVVELLVKMGYGGSMKDAGRAIGKSGDEGIDGIINEDKLGLDMVYIQAKRWNNTVSRPEIQKFAGALQGRRARKGVFITTSNFSKEAENYVSKIDNKIVLIDGEHLAQHLIDYDIGVSKVASYEIKKIDSDYFSEE